MLKLNLSCVGVIWMLALLTSTRSANAWQCQCTSITCQGQAMCEVTCESELIAALACLAGPGSTCMHIKIPAGCEVILTGRIDIGNVHNNLHLEIIGTVKYVLPGTPPPQPPPDEIMFRLSGCDNVRIDGGGIVTTGYPVTETRIPRAFQIVGGTSNLTIQDLTITLTGQAVTVDDSVAPAATDVTFRNLRIHDIRNFGISMDKTNIAVIENCGVWITSGSAHGIRFNASDVTVRNCYAYEIGSTGLWVQGGNTSTNPQLATTIDGFSGNRRVVLGPNIAPPPGGNENEFLRNVSARRIRLGGAETNVIVAMGTCGACVVNSCIATLEIGQTNETSCPVHVHFNKPLNHANWDALLWTTGNPPVFDIVPTSFPGWQSCNDAPNPLMGAPCLPPPDPYAISSVSYGYCFADVNADNVVNIDDLLGVITSWGNCPGLPSGVTSGPLPPCAADIVPHPCGNNVVNIDDLLLVITTWGPCPAHPMCGLQPATQGGDPEEPPQDIDDCWDKCTENYPDDEQGWIACFEACVEALRELGLIE